VAPSAPGGSLDILARMFARGLTDRLGQSFVVENRAGGGGNIGFDAVAKSTLTATRSRSARIRWSSIRSSPAISL
jgi:tripartite-type tricarboxylate transporter receptor subunit TctC